MTIYKDFTETIARTIVTRPEEIRVAEHDIESCIILELIVAPEDAGRVIGVEGRIAEAIRLLLRAAAASGQVKHRRVRLEIVVPEKARQNGH